MQSFDPTQGQIAAVPRTPAGRCLMFRLDVEEWRGSEVDLEVVPMFGSSAETTKRPGFAMNRTCINDSGSTESIYRMSD